MKLMLKKLLQNKYFLYGVSIVALGNVLGYLAQEHYNSLTFFLATGLLASYFSKNMAVVLLVAILATALFTSQKFIEGFKGKEGHDGTVKVEHEGDDGTNHEHEIAVKEKPEEKPETKEEEEKPSAEQEATDSAENSEEVATEAAVKDMENAQESYRNSMNATSKCFVRGADGAWQENGSLNQNQCSGPGKCWNTVASNCPQNFSNMKKKNNVGVSSREARVDGVDESVGDRIDYTETMNQAYGNLQQMLGADGMKGLAAETKKLVAQQKELVDSLGQMAPVLNSAKSTLDSLNLPDMKGITNVLSTLKGGK